MSSGTTDENFLLVRIVAGRHCGPPVHGTLRAPSGNPMAAPAHLVFAAAATPAVLSRGEHFASETMAGEDITKKKFRPLCHLLLVPSADKSPRKRMLRPWVLSHYGFASLYF